MLTHNEYKHIHATLKDHRRVRENRKLLIMSNQRLGEEKEEEESVYCSPPVRLVYALRHVHGFLDFTDDEDAGEHLFQLFLWDGLSGVPDGAVWSHHRLRSQVEGVIAAFRALRTKRGTEE